MKTFKPITPSLRNLIQLNKTHLNKKPLLKEKIKGLKQNIGKNFSGKIIVSSKGGGHKKKYRQINFKRIYNETVIVTSIEYDPYRSADIASVFNLKTKLFYYIIASKNLKIGDIIKSGPNAEIKNGHSLPISKIPVGCLIHNVSPKNWWNLSIKQISGYFFTINRKNY